MLLESFEAVYIAAKDSKLEPELFLRLEDHLMKISDYLKVNRNQALIVAMTVAANCQGDTVNIKELSDYIDCSPFTLLKLSNEFEALRKRGILIREKSLLSNSDSKLAENYKMSNEVIDAIMANQSAPEKVTDHYKDIFDLLHMISSLRDQCHEKDITTQRAFEDMDSALADHMDFPLVQKVSAMNMEPTDKFLYLYLIWKTLNGCTSVDISRIITGIIDNPPDRIRIMQRIMMLDSDLSKSDLVVLKETDFFNDTEFSLSDKSLDILKESGISLFVRKRNKKNIISPADIIPKKLVFNPDEDRQLEMVRNLLDKENLNETRLRLADRNLTKGIAILLHGAPGTGKTESVFQIAREVNREIIKIDISESKSMWFGESEKIVKKIFTDYREYAGESDRLPILFFNEADGIISRRKKVTQSNVAQTENAIQNIILEELERFDGIFFATTNLIMNLDPAFDRRFLFKIEIKKPEAFAKALIWKLKLPFLTEEACEKLANLYDFSGGQIDNIIRKAEINEILTGCRVKLPQLIELCDTEILVQGDLRPVVGFKRTNS